jgi:glycosyltransferase involved in cell wall biosynthesis
MKNKKKVAIFSGYFVPHLGGVERYTEKISIELNKMGYDVVVITFNHPIDKNIEKNKYYKVISFFSEVKFTKSISLWNLD